MATGGTEFTKRICVLYLIVIYDTHECLCCQEGILEVVIYWVVLGLRFYGEVVKWELSRRGSIG